MVTFKSTIRIDFRTSTRMVELEIMACNAGTLSNLSYKEFLAQDRVMRGTIHFTITYHKSLSDVFPVNYTMPA